MRPRWRRRWRATGKRQWSNWIAALSSCLRRLQPPEALALAAKAFLMAVTLAASLFSSAATVAGRKAAMGALRLYLDFINLFLMLLRLFGDRRE